MRWWKLIRKAPKLIARIALNLDEAEPSATQLAAVATLLSKPEGYFFEQED